MSFPGKDHKLTLPHSRLVSFVLTAAAAAISGGGRFYFGEYWSTPESLTAVHKAVDGRMIDLPGSRLSLMMLAFPVVVSFLPLILPRLKRRCAVALLAFSVLGAMSIGLLFLPGAIVLFLPEPTPKPRDGPGSL